MRLAPSTCLGPYEILAPIGAGGMGEVYKARDTRLDRTVAVKVLPAEWAGDVQRRQRFEREARAVSALNHPHICTLYDIGNHDGIDYLVMEYVEGKPLKGPLPVEEALRLGVQMADALDQAHRKGVFHRDLKPGNILVNKAGVKLLDFGLAKLVRPPVEGDAETLTKALTAEGSIVGTLQYMAPEQLGGEEADARSDIFSFGAVLYEMLTGRRAFDGKNKASVIAAILHVDPPALSSLQPLTPPALERVVATCLAKDRDDRWQTARDLKRELEWAAAPAAEEREKIKEERGTRKVVAAWAAASGLLLAAALSLGWLWWRASSRPMQVTRFQIQPPSGTRFFPRQAPILTRDGRKLAFSATKDGVSRLYVQPLDTLEARVLPETEGARAAFWSPDGASLAFQSGDKLRRIDLAGGSPRVLHDMTSGLAGDWNADGVILFRRVMGGAVPLERIADTGGAVSPATAADKKVDETRHILPHFLTDGRRFLFFSQARVGERNRVMLASLDSPQPTEVLKHNRNAVFTRAPEGRFGSRGYLLTMSDRTLMAYPFDERRGAVAGGPVAVAGDVGLFSVSATGTLAYLPAYDYAPFQGHLAWFDRAGKPLGDLPAAIGGFWPELSPDGTKVAVHRPGSGKTLDIWITDLERKAAMRLTLGAGSEVGPVWSPDGKRVAFTVEGRLMEKDSSGAGNERTLSGEEAGRIEDWSADGRFILLSPRRGTGLGLSLLPLARGGKPVALVPQGYDGQLSADGRFLAYVSLESGGPEVYVRPLPPAEGKWLISTGGGMKPRWRRDGRELFYVTPDQKMMAVEVKTGVGFQWGIPRALFQIAGHAVRGERYAVTADGQRFLVYLEPEDQFDRPITVVENWHATLGK